MSIDTSNINTGGGVITLGGSIVHAPDANGYYWDTVSGVDAGCTTGGIKITYKFEKKDIFCDQTLAAVESSVISESAQVSFNMLESDAAHLKYAISQCEYLKTAGVSEEIGVGGITELNYIALKIEIPDNDNGNLTTWTFYRVLSNGIEINFDRDNPTQVVVTFEAYADTSHPVGHQLFSVYQDITP